LRKWGPDILQEVKEYIPVEDRLAKTLKARYKKASPTIPTSPLIKLPLIDFPDLPDAPSKARPIPPPQPPPTRRTTKRRTKKVEELQDEIIEPPTTVSVTVRPDTAETLTSHSVALVFEVEDICEATSLAQ